MRRGPIYVGGGGGVWPICVGMQDIEREFSTGDFGIRIEVPARVAFMRLERETRGMGGGEMAELARRLASTRRALVAAGYRVRYVDEGVRENKE